ncbi:hypothetical protein NicSoilC5_20110 [Arthrobacter sp. NicSoilC5]|nr:hypothetical protein NicSoilC5_20110 [Arthrobacter sp. NicSoilC5]
MDACQLDAGPSRANEKYAYQRLVMEETINPAHGGRKIGCVTFRRRSLPQELPQELQLADPVVFLAALMVVKPVHLNVLHGTGGR